MLGVRSRAVWQLQGLALFAEPPQQWSPVAVNWACEVCTGTRNKLIHPDHITGPSRSPATNPTFHWSTWSLDEDYRSSQLTIVALLIYKELRKSRYPPEALFGIGLVRHIRVFLQRNIIPHLPSLPLLHSLPCCLLASPSRSSFLSTSPLDWPNFCDDLLSATLQHGKHGDLTTNCLHGFCFVAF